MQSLEQSCRQASDYFRSLGDKSRDHKNRERMYKLSLDTLCAAVWIENMRKFKFMCALVYPECYKDVWRAVNDTVVSIDESSIYPKVLKSYHSTLAEVEEDV